MNFTEQHIEGIIRLFHKAGVWNDGKFMRYVSEYCNSENLETEIVNETLEVAFHDYLATNIKSENAIRFRLKKLITNKFDNNET